MKKIAFLIFVAAALFFSSYSHAASALDVGTNYRLRGITTTKPDYGQTSDQDISYYSQRALAYIGGHFTPNIEMRVQFQALGIAGSSGSISNLSADQTNGRYPNTSFTPWVQSAYLKATHVYDLPVDLTIGRQPITIGDGFLLSDDDLGFTGIRMQSELPFYGLQSDLFTFKVADSILQNKDTDIYGLQITKPTHAVRYQLMWLMEKDNTGSTKYVRPSENEANLNGNLLASRIRREFYDARIEGHLLEGGFYKGEFAMQRGRVDRDAGLRDQNGNDISGIELSGYGMLISAGLYTKTSKFGPIEVHGTFGLGSGDSGDPGKDSSFNPSFGHRYDGLERSGFGEYYGATVYDAFASSSNPHGLPPGNSGIRVIGGGITTHPTALLSIGIDYFVYDALENNIMSFPNTSVDSSLGSEFDIGAGFAYTNYLTFRTSFAFFDPGSAYQYADKARRFLLEAVGRF